jgi:hypothetical protein
MYKPKQTTQEARQSHGKLRSRSAMTIELRGITLIIGYNASAMAHLEEQGSFM